MAFKKDLQYYKFSLYGFLKNLRFFDPFLVLFFLEKGLSYLEIGTLYAVREIAINILEVPTGVIADAFGRRRTMVFSFISYILSFIIFFLSSGFLPFLGAIVLFAFGDAFRTGTHKAMIFTYLRLNGWEKEKSHYYGQTRGWSQVGSAVSALIAAALVFWQGNYSTVFLYSIIPYVGDLLLMLSYPKALDGSPVARETSVAGEFKRVIKAFAVSFKNPAVLRAIGNQSIASGFYKALKDFLQPLLKSLALSLPVILSLADQQRTAVIVGVVYFVLYMLTSVSARYSGRFSELFKTLAVPLNLTLLAVLLLGAGSGFLHRMGFSSGAIVLFIGIYILENLRKPMGVSYVSELMDEGALATALSAESQAETLFAAVFAFILGAAAEAFGLGNGLMLTAGAAMILGLFTIVKKADTAAKE